MTVALVLAGEADAGLCGQLAALGVRRIDAADGFAGGEGSGPGLLTVAAAARAAGERVLICVGADTVPEPVLARLLRAGGTAAFTGVTARTPPPQIASGALVVDPPDLDALARAAETLAVTPTGPSATGALINELGRRGVTVRILDAGPDSEGAVTQLIADPPARDMARWAAWRQLTPGALYGISLGLGLVAALWFAELSVHAKLLAIAALTGSFLFARTGSLLAATSREGRIRPLVGWLGTVCGLLTELADQRAGRGYRSGAGLRGRERFRRLGQRVQVGRVDHQGSGRDPGHRRGARRHPGEGRGPADVEQPGQHWFGHGVGADADEHALPGRPRGGGDGQQARPGTVGRVDPAYAEGGKLAA